MAIVAAATVTLSALASGKVVYDAANDLYKGQGGKFNLTLGLRKDGDVLLHEESISPGSGPGYQTREFKYRCRRNEVITYVVAEDKRGDGTGGSPELISGGAGQDHIIIEVTSQLCRGFDFTVSVYGKRRWYYAVKRSCCCRWCCCCFVIQQ